MVGKKLLFDDNMPSEMYTGGAINLLRVSE